METNHTPQPDLREMFADFEPEPSDAVWTGIEARLQPAPRKVAPWVWWSSAAAVVLLLITGGLMLTLSPEAPRSFTEQENLPESQTLPAPLPEVPQPDLALKSVPEESTPEQNNTVSPAPRLAIGENGPKKSSSQSPQTPQDTTREEKPAERPRPQLEVAPLSLETVYFSQNELPARKELQELPALEQPPVQTPEQTPDKLQGEDPLFGKIVNAGNTLFNLPAEYSSTETGDTREEEFHADFRIIKIKKHTTYRN